MVEDIRQRQTRQRQIVLDEVRSRCDHPSADDIYLSVRGKDSRISRGTVYRNLRVLSDNGDVLRIRVPGSDRYDLRCDSHCHLLCTECGKVVDAPVSYPEEWNKEIENCTGFKIKGYSTVLEGICPQCRCK
ncbi:MAG: transcriptional repressor [Sphaerochaetaceae bacterium]|nr:transcriptional repressor [Sphaerochaetaceae bacterium]